MPFQMFRGCWAQVFDNWEGQPGAAVVSEGASATRERRLLDWANEMETLVTTQVSEAGLSSSKTQAEKSLQRFSGKHVPGITFVCLVGCFW